MATKVQHRSQRSRQLRRVRKAVCGQWLFMLLARTLTTIIVMVVARWLHLPGCGGE